MIRRHIGQSISKVLPNPTDGSELVLIPAGTFLAGDDKHEVNLPAYYIGKHAVTNKQWDRFCKATSREFNCPEGKASHPVVNISWHDAQAYCTWAGVRLPTEMEWEKAARGTDGRTYPWGNELGENKYRHWRNKDSEETCPVIAYPEGASPYGCLNMTGNVWEWCADRGGADTHSYYRAVRGGSWCCDITVYFRCASRFYCLPGSQFVYFGFRVARDA